MRVVAGEVRGRRLMAPEGPHVRPSSGRVREAVFNALGSRGAIDGAEVLDLFAGCGALGIEALSRGAAHVTFVDNDRRSIDAVRLNLERLGLLARATVVAAEAHAYLLHRFGSPPLSVAGIDSAAGIGSGPAPGRIPDNGPRPVDLVFVDPPYSFDDWPALVDLLSGIAGATVVIESDRQVEFAPGWRVQRAKRYGGTVVTFAAFDVGS